MQEHFCVHVLLAPVQIISLRSELQTFNLFPMVLVRGVHVMYMKIYGVKCASSSFSFSTLKIFLCLYLKHFSKRCQLEELFRIFSIQEAVARSTCPSWISPDDIICWSLEYFNFNFLSLISRVYISLCLQNVYIKTYFVVENLSLRHCFDWWLMFESSLHFFCFTRLNKQFNLTHPECRGTYLYRTSCLLVPIIDIDP